MSEAAGPRTRLRGKQPVRHGDGAWRAVLRGAGCLQPRWNRKVNAEEERQAEVNRVRTDADDWDRLEFENQEMSRKIEEERQMREELERKLQQEQTEKQQLQNQQEQLRSRQSFQKKSFLSIVTAFAFIALVVNLKSCLTHNAIEAFIGEHQRMLVRAYVQRSDDSKSGFKLPTGESPNSLLRFLNHKTTRIQLQLDTGASVVEEAAPFVYVTVAQSGRLDEMLFDWKQISRMERIDGFIFVWIASASKCEHGNIPRSLNLFVQTKFPGSAVGFICWWDAFIDTPFSEESIDKFTAAIQSGVTLASK